MIKFVILHDVFFGQGPRLLNISNHVLKLLVISKHGIYDLYVLRVLAEQCPEQAEGALDLIGNLLSGSSRIGLGGELFGFQEDFQLEVFAALTLRVGHRIDLAQTLNYFIAKIIHITFGLPLLNSE